jgi:hypothetical protein
MLPAGRPLTASTAGIVTSVQTTLGNSTVQRRDGSLTSLGWLVDPPTSACRDQGRTNQ